MLTDGYVDPDSTETENVLLAANELEYARYSDSGMIDNITVADCLNAAKILRAVVMERDELTSKITKEFK